MLGAIVKTLFGGSGAASDGMKFAQEAARGVGNFLDEQKFTTEERAQVCLKTGDMMLDMIKSTQGENSVRSITRRYLAWGVTIFVGLWASIAMGFAIGGSQATVDSILSVANRFYIGEGFVAVMSFYFLANVVRATR